MHFLWLNVEHSWMFCFKLSFKHTCNTIPLMAGNSIYTGDEFGPPSLKLEEKMKGTKGNKEYSMSSWCVFIFLLNCFQRRFFGFFGFFLEKGVQDFFFFCKKDKKGVIPQRIIKLSYILIWCRERNFCQDYKMVK